MFFHADFSAEFCKVFFSVSVRLEKTHFGVNLLHGVWNPLKLHKIKSGEWDWLLQSWKRVSCRHFAVLQH